VTGAVDASELPDDDPVMKLQFLGAAGTVTGSKYLLRSGRQNVLIDCGLFQGYKRLRKRNWEAFELPPSKLSAVVLTHAHLDHSGWLPRLVRQGYSGPIYATAATRDLCEILLLDSARLQEEEAGRANRHGYSRHKPALPLYTQSDAERALKHFVAVRWDDDVRLKGGISISFRRAGHILGAASVIVRRDQSTIVFSGDVGRPHDPLFFAPAAGIETDFLIVESTYGDRLHAFGDPLQSLAAAVNRVLSSGGTVVVPAFAVGRAQLLMYYFEKLRAAGRIEEVPIFLDSPMATSVTRLYQRHSSEHRLRQEDLQAIFNGVRFVSSVQESKELTATAGAKIIIASSGMATGGRVLHHLTAFAPDPRNQILLPGFQAGGTRAADIARGVEAVKIHGAMVPIRATVTRLEHFSAHADADEMIEWLKSFPVAPQRTFITHGEPSAADAFRKRIGLELGWECEVPAHGDRYELASADVA
jgi:metallo-beta-lactamase family protein